MDSLTLAALPLPHSQKSWRLPFTLHLHTSYKMMSKVYSVDFEVKALQSNAKIEFAPYVFQLFAALLEANQRSSLTDYYRSLITPILTPELWALKGNVPALVRLLSSLISRGAADIAQQNQLERVLEVFKRLIATKTHETHGFELLECIISSFSP